MQGRGRRPQQPHDRVGLAANRSYLGEAGDGQVHIEKLGDSARWRSVENHGVVGVRAVFDLPSDCLVHLAGEQYVTQPRGYRGGEVDSTETVKCLAGDAEVVKGVEVLDQGSLGIDRQAVHHASRGRTADPALPTSG